MSITENKERIGNFTSSQIYKLLGSAKVRATYVEEKQLERRLGRSLSLDKYGRAMSWGHFMELVVFDDLLGMEYEDLSDKTKAHPSVKGWSGSTDFLVKGEKVSDLKAYEPKKFAQYTDAILSKDIEKLKNGFKQEYFQLVSNAIIHDVPNAEAISFMPYESDLEDIKEMAANYEDPNGQAWKYRFITESKKAELAYLPDGGYYKNFNRFEFEVPETDKILLINAVLLATKELG